MSAVSEPEAVSSTPMMGTELRGGRYALVRTLGEGSQGETFEAVDKREGRLVAIKRFRVGKAKAWKDVELAEREATTLASLEHELLPRYIEHFEEDGALVLVMERIEGESLAALRKQNFRASVPDIQRLLSDASRALDYLHGRAPPVVHRDLKPGNVIRRPDGSFAFVDFGAVRDRLKLEGGSTVVGTFGYMAPEQFQGRASAASDVYGIGATALALLTGCEPEELPHKGLAIDVPKAVPESTPSWLVRTLAAMLEPDPDKRASSVREAMARGGGTTAGDSQAPSKRATRDTKDTSWRPGASRRDRGARNAERQARKARIRGRAAFLHTVALPVLLVSQLVVWFVVGLVVPLVLTMLSLIFGAALRRAADACRRASQRAGSAIARRSGWLGADEHAHDEERAHDEAREEPAESDAVPRVRVAAADVLRQVRSLTPEQAQREAMRRAELRGDDDPEAWAERVATEEAERWEPPEAWVEREAREEEEAKKRKAAKKRS